ncbi:MFS transporter [Specibacter cremeus]|uniref:MFS transporter n=1 Tax=Specibacter cremeus TaxID=1629051 RepID=UPI000F7816E4|nr:MFS transporter [Specibacter cremeus]
MTQYTLAGGGQPTPEQRKTSRKAAGAALIGTSIEWFDFYAFGTAAALVFGELFFPKDLAPAVATLAAMATFAAGFVLRPLGGIVFGHLGDRIGRKKTLIITLVMMGVASIAIGLLPTHAQVGGWAAVLLVGLRVVQGLAIGGEWGGAVLVAVENAPANRRSFYGSFPQMGSSVGALLSTGLFALLNSVLSHEQFLAFGWRVPFLASAVLVVVGFLIRRSLDETPAMKQVLASAERSKLPVLDVVRTAPGMLVLGVLTLSVGTGGYYMVTTYLTTYGTEHVGLNAQLILSGLSIAAAVELVITPVIGWLGDRRTPHLVVMVGLLAVLVIAPFQFLVLNTGSALLITAAMVAMRIAQSAAFAPVSSVLAEAFTPAVRYTGISISYQFANLIFGGLVPLGAVALLVAIPSAWPVVVALMVMSAVGAASVWAMRRTWTSTPAGLREHATECHRLTA